MKIGWKYWSIMLAFLLVGLVIIVPKTNFTLIKFTEKPVITKCVCECKQTNDLIENWKINTTINEKVMINCSEQGQLR